ARPDSYTDTGEVDDDTTIYFTWNWTGNATACYAEIGDSTPDENAGLDGQDTDTGVAGLNTYYVRCRNSTGYGNTASDTITINLATNTTSTTTTTIPSNLTTTTSTTTSIPPPPEATTTTIPGNGTTTSTSTTIVTTTTTVPTTTPPSGGGYTPSGPYKSNIVNITNAIVSNLTKNITKSESLPAVTNMGEISLWLTDAPDSIEAGEPYIVTVLIRADRSIYNAKLMVDDTEETISLSKDVEKRFTYTLTAPEANGSFTLIANLSSPDANALASKTIKLDYKPLFLYTNTDGNKLSLTVKVYEEPSTTEIEITRNGASVYTDQITGKKVYDASLKLEPGEYKILARTKTSAGIVDADVRNLSVQGEAGIDYGMLIWAMAFIVIIIIIYFFRRTLHKKNEIPL
ncbi:MAG: hypothetical protein NT129_01850, partial [Candidatus Aenigmarchaeota archaeon]|nr:hypothetical protein [Candidatus Aenigmarchaeota archaeon]